jgi:hypothetical protein
MVICILIVDKSCNRMYINSVRQFLLNQPIKIYFLKIIITLLKIRYEK